ncbi:hypothetical protein M5K25_023353 [Dendrobium thyrsiflorum]|uniref:Uncharacterized protein n=1 Tax=Dendrobium thyrsiflorum TaxID=117978 RepID=A0ABD0UEN4_DENTH
MRISLGTTWQDVCKSHHGNGDLLPLVLPPKRWPVTIQRALHDRVRRRRIHFLQKGLRELLKSNGRNRIRQREKLNNKLMGIPAAVTSWRPRERRIRESTAAADEAEEVEEDKTLASGERRRAAATAAEESDLLHMSPEYSGETPKADQRRTRVYKGFAGWLFRPCYSLILMARFRIAEMGRIVWRWFGRCPMSVGGPAKVWASLGGPTEIRHQAAVQRKPGHTLQEIILLPVQFPAYIYTPEIAANRPEKYMPISNGSSLAVKVEAFPDHVQAVSHVQGFVRWDEKKQTPGVPDSWTDSWIGIRYHLVVRRNSDVTWKFMCQLVVRRLFGRSLTLVGGPAKVWVPLGGPTEVRCQAVVRRKYGHNLVVRRKSRLNLVVWGKSGRHLVVRRKYGVKRWFVRKYRRNLVVRRKSKRYLVVRRKIYVRRWSSGSTEQTVVRSGGGPAVLRAVVKEERGGKSDLRSLLLLFLWLEVPLHEKGRFYL